MRLKLWHFPYNGLSIWFDRANLRRCKIGWGDIRQDHVNWSFWWAIFGFSGGLTLQSWPWQQNPARK